MVHDVGGVVGNVVVAVVVGVVGRVVVALVAKLVLCLAVGAVKLEEGVCAAGI